MEIKEKSKLITKNYIEKYYELRVLNENYKNKKELELENFKIDSVLNIYIEPTNSCNLKCYFCAREKSEREISYLSFESFKNIIENIPVGSYITLTGNGEPLLNKSIYEMISFASNKGMLVGIITNGTPLTEKNSRKLIESGVSRIQLSFDTVDKELYEKIRLGARYKDTLDKVLKFIYMVRKEYNSDLYISVSSVQTEEVKQFSKQSKIFWESMPIDNYYEGELLSLQTESDAYEELEVETKECWNICSDPWIVAKVNADGSVNNCPQDFSSKYIIGNLEEEKFLDILNSQKALDLRQALYKCDKDEFERIKYNCHKCNTWKRSVGYGIGDFINDSLPIRLSLALEQVRKGSGKNNKDTTKLEEAIAIIEKDGSVLEWVEQI